MRQVGILFTVLLLALGWFLALLGSVHGPALFAYFVFAYLLLAEALLWIGYWTLRRQGYAHGKLWLASIGVLLGAGLVAASQGSWGVLADWEYAREQRVAAATQVFDVHDQPLLSARGNPIGIRVQYSMRFPTSDYFWQTPSVRAEKDFRAGLWGDGRFTQPSVTPAMQPGKTGVPRYEQGRQYDFTADVLPYFLTQNKDRSRVCIVEPLPEYRAGFERLIAGGEALHYKISIQGTTFQAESEHAYSPKTFYESALREGAVRLPGSGLGGWAGACP